MRNVTFTEDDIIRTLKANLAPIGHFHTAGNPGRNERDGSQELYYPPNRKAFSTTDYSGCAG